MRTRLTRRTAMTICKCWAAVLIAVVFLVCGCTDSGKKTFESGVSASQTGEHDKAITDFTEAIRLAPKRADAYYNRGVAYGNNGEHDKAIADYNEAIRLNPQYVTAYYGRAYACG